MGDIGFPRGRLAYPPCTLVVELRAVIRVTSEAQVAQIEKACVDALAPLQAEADRSGTTIEVKFDVT